MTFIDDQDPEFIAWRKERDRINEHEFHLQKAHTNEVEKYMTLIDEREKQRSKLKNGGYLKLKFDKPCDMCGAKLKMGMDDAGKWHPVDADTLKEHFCG